MKKMGGKVPGRGFGWDIAGRKGENHRVHTEWQLPLSGLHSIMAEKLAQPGEGGVAPQPPFTVSTITYKVIVYALAEGADTLPLFLLYSYMYSVVTIARGLEYGKGVDTN